MKARNVPNLAPAWTQFVRAYLAGNVRAGWRVKTSIRRWRAQAGCSR
jgi:hypothetical protein